MKCILMNKNTPVIEVEVDEDTATISKVIKVYELEFLPIGKKKLAIASTPPAMPPSHTDVSKLPSRAKIPTISPTQTACPRATMAVSLSTNLRAYNLFR